MVMFVLVFKGRLRLTTQRNDQQRPEKIDRSAIDL